MKRLILALIMLGFAAPLNGFQVQFVTYESVTVAGTVVGLSTATISPPARGNITRCQFRLETAQIRYRWDQTDPTATEGILLEVGEILDIANFQTAQRIRFIRTGATSGVLKGNCWK